MTIYWERCDICGRHLPTKTCWLHPELSVCPHCCLLCPERSLCPNPAWFPGLRLSETRVEARVASSSGRGGGMSVEEKRRKLEELLRKLSGE